MHTKRSPHIEQAHNYWASHLKPGDVALDATAGNGRDTLFLAKLGCHVIAYDIQQDALEHTWKRLEEAGLSDLVQCHLACHSTLQAGPYKAVIYNLGYLPGGNKSLTTTTPSTLLSLECAYQNLADDGFLSITCYPGHSAGEDEEAAIFRWSKPLDHRWIVYPSKEKRPSLLIIKKIL